MIQSFTIAVFVLILAAGVNAGAYYALDKKNGERIRGLERQVSELETRLQQQVLGAYADQAATDDQNKTAENSSPSPVGIPADETNRRQAVAQASQDELLTSVVEKVSSAVVSIVISKDVPQLEVVYENPFGDDPFFRDFGMRIPRYRQKGTVRQKVGGGTGFLVRSDGYILTNKHVVADTQASYTVLVADGSQKEAQVVYKDGALDLAVVKIDGSGYKTVDLGNSADLKLGQTVIAIGNALAEYNNSVSVGIISGLNRTIEASGQALSGVIQTDAAINPGNSGGPLVDLHGKVVAVNVATVVGASSISFSIPINEAKEIIDTVLK